MRTLNSMSTSERASSSSSSEQPGSQAVSQAGSGGARAPTPYTGRRARQGTDGGHPTRQAAHQPASAVGRTLRPACQTLRCPCPPASLPQSGINLHVKVHFGFQSHGVSRCLRYCRVASVSPPSNISSAQQPAKVASRLTVRSSRLLRLPRLPVLRSAFTGLLDSDKNIDIGCI